MAKISDEEIMDMVSEKKVVTAPTEQKEESASRRLLVVGCGDGGCNIASEIGKALPGDAYVIAYNTTERTMDGFTAHKKIVPGAEDGSGKNREYSKDVLKQGSYKYLLEAAKAAIEKHGEFAYIVVCTTADGGTGSGSSPIVAKLLATNTNVPTIVIGVYPTMDADATSQYNTLQWQADIAKTGLPYFIYDNNIPGLSQSTIHVKINREIAAMAKVLSGNVYGFTNIAIIDNRNLYMLVQHCGGRLVMATSSERLGSEQNLDDYLINIIDNCHQPVPANVKGIGLFVKAPKAVLDKIDTGIPGVQAKYGSALIHFNHLEESEETVISILLTGCSEPQDRMDQVEGKYNDILAAQLSIDSIAAGMASRVKNPMGSGGKVAVKKVISDDLSALDI